jgi:hypothetical protein
MKKLIPVIALLIGASGAFGQGIVAFRNDNLTTPNHLVLGSDMMTALTGSTFAAQLLYGNDPASLQAHPTLAYFRAPTTSSPGTWSGGGRTLPTGFGGVGTTIWLQVVAWDSGASRTTTFDMARTQGGLWGQGQVFSYQQVLSPIPNPVEDTKMLNFVGFSLVPEPSVIGLGLIGIGALFMLRRRKA